MTLKLFQCDNCKKEFRRSDYLLRHKNRKYPCKSSVGSEDKKNVDLVDSDIDFNVLDEPKVENINPEIVKPIINTLDKYPLTNFNLKMDYKTGNILGFIMASGSGKTTLMKHIYIEYFEDPKLITILFASNLQASIYDDFGDKKYIIKTFEFNPMIPKIQHKIQSKTKNKYNFLNILDDQIGNDIKNNKTLQKMLTSYRNSKMSAMLSAQYCKMFSKTNRGNIKYLFFGHLNTDEAIRDVIVDYLGSLFNGLNIGMIEKIKIYRNITSDFKFILMQMNNNNLSFHKLNL